MVPSVAVPTTAPSSYAVSETADAAHDFAAGTDATMVSLGDGLRDADADLQHDERRHHGGHRQVVAKDENHHEASRHQHQPGDGAAADAMNARTITVGRGDTPFPGYRLPRRCLS